MLHIEHSDLVMQDYLQPNDLSIKESKFTFIARTRMIDIKGNYSGQYSDTLCPLCEVEEDIQPHLLECAELCDDSSIVRTLPEYEKLFSDNLEDKALVSRILMAKFNKRKTEMKKK